MLINFNIEKLDKLLYDFYSLTGITISVWDASFKELSFQPKKVRRFCRMIKATEKGRCACYLSDKKLCSECSKTGKPTTHHCHAGLVDVAFPIKYKDTVMGYIMFGQISDKSTEQMSPFIEGLCKELGINNAELTNSYNELIRYDENIISSAANILKQATRYLWLSEYIDIGYDTIAAKADEYVRSHINESLSVSSICRALNISKKHLYEISHKHFNAPIGEYICSVRIEKAKQLLTSTDYTIQQISYMVGIQDYNYFTKFFKSKVGTAPLRYRKNFPLSLYEDGK
ncbi:MAG: PocR ligand-binding domain-containing protein [Clostridia bacterium]|nr:PocR ligand-binding domain-containing protein [Clostridia bacterium]